MLKIDSHQHYWHYSEAEYGWIDESKRAIRRDFLPEHLQAEITAAGVDRVLAVQARQTLTETKWLLDLAQQHHFITGVVGWVPLSSPHVAATLDNFAPNAKLVGVRHLLQDEPDAYMLCDDFLAGIRLLRQYRLVYDALILEQQLPSAIELVDRFPNQMFVLDHMGKPRIRDRALSPWRERIRQLAERPNVFCKMSGLVTEADYANWTEEQLRPFIDVAISAFSPKRLMFGSDWPVCLVASGYKNWVNLVERAICELSNDEQERIWSGTATEVYGLEPDL